MRPTSRISHTSASSSCQMRSNPVARACSRLLAATSCTASARSAAAAGRHPGGERRGRATSWRTASRSSTRERRGTSAVRHLGGRSEREHGPDVVRTAVQRAAAVGVDVDQGRVAAVRLGDHVGSQGLDVVRAQQPQRDVRLDREVEQRLVDLALGDLGGPAAGPDRLTDAAHRAAAGAVLVEEAAPGGDDARRVVADLRHVHEDARPRRRRDPGRRAAGRCAAG